MDIRAFHNSQNLDYKMPFGAVECGKNVSLRISVDGYVERAYARLWYEDSEKLYPMEYKDGMFFADVPMPKKPMLVWYMFVFECGGERLYYGKQNYLNPVGTLCNYMPDSFQITVYKKGFKTPAWFSDSIMYQIFVDRFCNGNENGEVFKKRDIYKIMDWNAPVPYDPVMDNSEFAKCDFYGGNLKGVMKKLDYLKELGIKTIYFNPIFEAYSNHKYDCANYMQIDSMFGDEEIFKTLCAEAKKKGISIILDGVFSHTGCDSIYFNKRGEYDSVGAYQSKKSPYYEWYSFEDYPDKYECWWGIPTLPNVREMNESYREYILNGEDSVIKHWIKAGARGWRLDVADELPDEFIKELRIATKSANKDAIVLGEVWEDASNKISYSQRREYLYGDELDSVMNYPFRDGLLGYIMSWHSAEHFNKIIMSLYENYPKPIFYSLMNHIGTHDSVRIKTMFGNAPDIPMEQRGSYRLPYEQEKLANKRVCLAALWQMTFMGVPCIYYGDEIGMQGYGDPFNRGPFEWDNMDTEILDWYKKLASIRNKYAVLRTGDYKALIASDDVLCYRREIKDNIDSLGKKRKNNVAFIAMNRNENSTHNLNLDVGDIKTLLNPITNEKINVNDGFINVMLPPVSGCIFIAGNDI